MTRVRITVSLVSCVAILAVALLLLLALQSFLLLVSDTLKPGGLRRL
jgi:hypothetical protein